MNDPISARQFHESEGLDDWRVLGEGACIFFRTDSFAESARFVEAIAEIPGWGSIRRPWTCARAA